MNDSSSPCVVVTGPAKTLRFGWWATHLCLKLAGLKAKYFTANSQVSNLNCQGIIIGGGDDIDPQHYGLSGDAGATYDSARDMFELKMVHLALEKQIPILGICRGAQLINVAMGGDLHRDLRPLRKKTPNRNSIFLIKKAILDKKSYLKQVFGSDNIGINSLHNQAIQTVAKDLAVAARDEDGFIQAVESHNRFVVGVQWHPEYLPYISTQRKLFKEFARYVNIFHKNQNSNQVVNNE